MYIFYIIFYFHLFSNTRPSRNSPPTAHLLRLLLSHLGGSNSPRTRHPPPRSSDPRDSTSCRSSSSRRRRNTM